MTLKCYWYQSSPITGDRCQADATDLIICGCKVHHINEIPFCSGHANAWRQGQMLSRKKCWQCHHGIIEYLTIDVMSIQDSYVHRFPA